MINSLLKRWSFVFIVIYSSNLRAELCENFFFSLPLHQQHLINEARKTDYKIEILRGGTANTPKTVILVGEVHIKGKEASIAGKNLLKEFHFRGLEGANINSYVAGHFLLATIKFQRLFAQKILARHRSEHSTITDAQIDSQVVSLLSHFKINNFSKSQAISWTKLNLENQSSKLGKLSLRRKALEEVLSVLEGKTPAPQSSLKTISLELGHKPSLIEHYYSLHFPISLAAPFIMYPMLTAGLVYPAVKSISMALIYSLSPISILNIVQKYGHAPLKNKFEDRVWFKRLFAIERALLDNRSKTMAQNINQAFKHYPLENELLVVVGQSHVHGIRQILKSKYNFHIVDNSHTTKKSPSKPTK